MNSRISAAVFATGLALAGLLGPESLRLAAATVPTSQGEGTKQGNAEWGKINVELPASATLFPPGDGSAVANGQCLICHSAGMVLLQPARTQGQWKDTINKMRSAYGAPLPAEQVDALATYLTRVIGVAAGDRHTPMAGIELPQTAEKGTHAADGAAIFAARCVACHQAAGTGLPGVFPPLAGSGWVNSGNVPLIQIVLHGVRGILTVNETRYNGVMPPFGDQLSDAEIAAVLTYVRSQWGNKGASVGAPLVTAQRLATRTHGGPWNGDAELAKMR